MSEEKIKTEIVRTRKGRNFNKIRRQAFSKIERTNLSVKEFGQIMCAKNRKKSKKK